DCETSQGPAFVYTPLVSRERIQRSRLRSLMDQLYDGAAGPLILQLVRDEGLTPDEVAELQALIKSLDQPAVGRKKKGGK
ncbi:MAG: BlaI/MecI/CopY family transcriptional regulator, partial [Phycisphaerales bacterium]|nr:BlaI/MecI/CopY family transcriptional regulator [Phycisphaerales bacterium]